MNHKDTKSHEYLTGLNRRQHRRHTRELLIEVARIRRVGNLRHERRGDAFVVHIVPVDVPEERVAHDLLRVGGPGAEPHVGLAREQLLQDRDRVARHVDRVERLVREDGVVDLVLVLAAERRLLQQHLVDEHAKGPPVDGPAVALVEQDLALSAA